MRETIRWFLKFLLVPKFSENLTSLTSFFIHFKLILFRTITTLLENNEISELQEALVSYLVHLPKLSSKE